MDLKKYFRLNGIKQVALSKQCKVPMAIISMHINNWRQLPEKHVKPLAKYLRITANEVRLNKINDDRLKQDGLL